MVVVVCMCMCIPGSVSKVVALEREHSTRVCCAAMRLGDRMSVREGGLLVMLRGIVGMSGSATQAALWYGRLCFFLQVSCGSLTCANVHYIRLAYYTLKL